MKTMISKLSLLALAAMPLLGGCTQPATNASVPVTQQTVADPTPPLTPPVIAESAAKAEPAPGTPPQLPPLIIQSAPALAEFSKLAQAGVDEGVMLSYITNSTQLFNATADQIVYLNDLGVPGSVITAMMQHDQSLKQFWAGNSSPSAPAAQTPSSTPAPTETLAAAPTYIHPPQPETVPVPSPQPTTVVNNNYFYDSLSPYGTWVEIEGYGRCWQPTVVVVNRDWRPYRDGGRWVYTDAGWYWLSDYSWGATAFHYGRWFTHPRWGWCWWPDTVWASSWVSWRYSGDYCGWAPIPPHYGYHSGVGFTYYGRAVSASFSFGLGWTSFNYVPWRNVCDPRPRRHCAPTAQIREIHSSTTVINNYGSGRNNIVLNNGVTPARVRELSRHEIKPIRLQEEQREIRNGNGRREQISPDGRTLTVSRPPLEDHRGNGRRDRETSPRPVGAPVANLNTSPSAPSATTSPRARDNESAPRSRNQLERGEQGSRGGRNLTTAPVTTPSKTISDTPSGQPRMIEPPSGRNEIESTRTDARANRERSDRNPGDKPTATIPVTQSPTPTPRPPATVSTPSVQPKSSKPGPLILDYRKNGRVDANPNNGPTRIEKPTASAPVATTAPAVTPSLGQHRSDEPATVRQRVEDRRNTTVQDHTPPKSAAPANIPNSQIVAPQTQPQPRTSQPAPAPVTTRVWTQPPQPGRGETQRQILPKTEERRQERSATRELPQQQIRTAPASPPRFTVPPQSPAPAVALPRPQTVESRPSPTPPSIRTESRSESRLEYKKSGSSNGDSNSGRRQR